MKLFKTGLLAATVLFCATNTFAQTADEIVSKYIQAIGGKDKLAGVKSLHLETSSQIMGNDAPGNVTILNGKGFKSETEFNGQKMVQCYTEKGGWATNPMSGGGAEAMPEEQYKSGKAQMQVGGELYDYAAKGSKVELLGKDGNLYKLKLTTKDSTETTYYIDPTTYYITKLTKAGEAMGQQVEIAISYSDYKKTDYGLVMAYSMQLDFGSMFSMAITTKKVDFNSPVDPKIFDMPSK
jgi:hypothetical protein